MTTRCFIWAGVVTIVIRYGALTLMMVAPLMAVAMAQSLEVYTYQEIYEYGDRLGLVIQVSEMTGQTATMFIRDDSGVSSSPISVQITGLRTESVSPLPFQRESYPPGTYYIDVVYGDEQASAKFILEETGVVVVPFWIKQVAYHWISGEVSGASYADALSQADLSGVTDIPSWLALPTIWWLQGDVDDVSYLHMMQYLASEGILS